MKDALTNETDPQPQFPRYVRVMAVAHVLSIVVGPVAFVVLASIGVFRWSRQGFVDDTAAKLLIAAVGCPLLCAAYRRWFEHWGRTNWPDGKPTE